jgi:hypothetical protein
VPSPSRPARSPASSAPPRNDAPDGRGSSHCRGPRGIHLPRHRRAAHDDHLRRVPIVKKLKPTQRAALGIPKTMQIKYKRMHSGWRAIKRVVEHGVLVDHDHDLDVDAAPARSLPCPSAAPSSQVEPRRARRRCSSKPACRPSSSDLRRWRSTAPTSRASPARTRTPDGRRGPRSSTPSTATPDGDTAPARPSPYRALLRIRSPHRHVRAEASAASPSPKSPPGLALRPGIRDRITACLNIVDACPRSRRSCSTADTPRPRALGSPDPCATATSP